MDFFYKDDDSTFSNCELLEIDQVQNYIPIYNNFFDLTEDNYNMINLNNSQVLSNIVEKKSSNIFSAEISDLSKNITTRDIFIKYSPLADPLKYLIDKYDEKDNIFELPKLNSSNINKKC